MKQLDRYSMMIIMKYFIEINDFYNIIQVCKKFKEIPEMFHYNPISYNSKADKLFPNIETQYLYSCFDEKKEGIEKFVAWYYCPYKYYLTESNDSFKCIKVILKNRDHWKNGLLPLIVTDIEDNCFASCNLNNIQLNTRVTSIGVSAFAQSYYLTSIVLSPYLKELPPRLFYDCFNLISIEMPLELTYIGRECFYYCSSLTSLKLSNWINNLETSTFNGCRALRFIDLPSTLKRIEDSCFSHCQTLTSIVIPSSVTHIGAFAFHHCSLLESVKFPVSLKVIRDETFSYCKRLRKIDLSNDLEYISSNSFAYCYDLRTIQFPTTLLGIHQTAFFSSSISKQHFPTNLTNLKKPPKDSMCHFQ